MKTKNLRLNSLKVKSFLTSANAVNSKTVKGGLPTDDFNMPSLKAIGCLDSDRVGGCMLPSVGCVTDYPICFDPQDPETLNNC